jgi:Ca2+-transporting ATPase
MTDPSALPDAEWHRQPTTDLFAALSTGPDGLATDGVAARRARFGANELTDKGTKRASAILWEQLTAVMVLLLIGASLLSLALGKFLEAGAIGAIVVLFALLGFFQEYRAEHAIAALRRMAVPTVRAMRDGRTVEIAAVDLVPGDVVVLEAGNVVPADLRLFDVANLRVQEAALTGESEPIEKIADVIDRPDVAIGDRHNMAYLGTQVTYGRALGIVVATGMATELGRIATLLQGVSTERTALQDKLDGVGKQLAVAGVAVALVVVALGALAGESASNLVLTAISVAVAVIPEGLPAVVTFTLAVGAQRMLRRNALIRRLPAVETLGSVTVICSDKTGTLTQNVMTVTAIETTRGRVLLDDASAPIGDAAHDVDPALVLACVAGVLCNDAEVQHVDDGDDVTIGDPTETALLVAARRQGIDVDALRRALPRVDEIPFDSDRKRMCTVHRVDTIACDPASAPGLLRAATGARHAVLVKGAIDGLLPQVTTVWTDDGPSPMDDGRRQRIESANDELAADGRRVLAVAMRTIEDLDDRDQFETDLTLVGLFGIIDPPRPEVRDAVATCATAGIAVKMITGDHPLTAQAIARGLDIDADEVLTGAQLNRLDERELVQAVRSTSVFARVSPEHKLRIVQALRDDGQIVAMTGDGVNDAPALKKADIGVAMGITGTDVSKEAADMVLRDDNFTTVVAAVEEGRVIYDNLRRFVKFAVAGNIGKILVMVLWPVPYLLAGGDINDPSALLPLQLLWLNLMTDGLLGLSMGVEPAERGVMQRPPHDPGASIWAGGLGRQAVWTGVFLGAAALAVGWAYHAADQSQWQSMIFTSLAFMQIFQALGTRSATETLRRLGLRTNPTMLLTVAGVVTLQLAALYTPLSTFLDLEPLGALDLAICVGLGVALLGLLEGYKLRLAARLG